MGRRPLCVVLLLLVLGIIFVHKRWEQSLSFYDGEKQTFVCELIEVSGQKDSCTMLVQDVHSSQGKICHRMKLYIGEDTNMPEELHMGNLLRIEASVYSFSTPGNPGQFNEYQFYTQQGISYKAFASEIAIEDARRDIIRDSLYQLRCYFQQIIDHCCEQETAGIVSAMVLGDRSGLSEETKQLYQENGVAHVLAISGVKTQNLVILKGLEKPINWAFMRLHISKIYIKKRTFKGEKNLLSFSKLQGGNLKNVLFGKKE